MNEGLDADEVTKVEQETHHTPFPVREKAKKTNLKDRAEIGPPRRRVRSRVGMGPATASKEDVVGVVNVLKKGRTPQRCIERKDTACLVSLLQEGTSVDLGPGVSLKKGFPWPAKCSPYGLVSQQLPKITPGGVSGSA